MQFFWPLEISDLAIRADRVQHDEMIEGLAEYLKARDFSDIRANLEERYKPKMIAWKETERGHMPDLAARLENRWYLFEVETGYTLADGQTPDKWKLFSANARESGKEFVVVVPENYRCEAETRITSQEVAADVWVMVNNQLSFEF